MTQTTDHVGALLKLLRAEPEQDARELLESVLYFAAESGAYCFLHPSLVFEQDIPTELRDDLRDTADASAQLALVECSYLHEDGSLVSDAEMEVFEAEMRAEISGEPQ